MKSFEQEMTEETERECASSAISVCSCSICIRGLDALGNWSSNTTSSGTQTRTSDAANEITDVSGTWADPTYDAAGNMTTIPQAGNESVGLTGIYDGWNHLVALRDGNRQTIVTYEYDGFGRRIAKILDGARHDYYYNEQYQIIEETWVQTDQLGTTTTTKDFVEGMRYADDLVHVYVNVHWVSGSGGGSYDPVNASLGVVQDANWNVTAMVRDAGVAERYVYSPYGQRTVLSPNWQVKSSSDMGIGLNGYDITMPFGHQGLYLDTESGMYYNRARYYHPALGTFVQRDPLGYVDGNSLYGYEIESPETFVDPYGLFVPPPVPIYVANPITIGIGISVYAGAGLGTVIVRVTHVDQKIANGLYPMPAAYGQPLPQPKYWSAPKACPNGVPPKDCQIHHIGTEYPNERRSGGRNSRDEMNGILGQGGLNVDSWQNQCQVCNMGDGLTHGGPHEMEYHDAVINYLRQVTREVRQEFPQASGEILTSLIRLGLQAALGGLCEALNSPGNCWRNLLMGN